MLRLKELRISRGLTLRQLADTLDISQSAICMYENGRREPDLSTLGRLCDYFGVSADCMLFRCPPSSPPGYEKLTSEERAHIDALTALLLRE